VTLSYVYLAAKHYTPGWSILDLYGFFAFVGGILAPAPGTQLMRPCSCWSFAQYSPTFAPCDRVTVGLSADTTPGLYQYLLSMHVPGHAVSKLAVCQSSFRTQCMLLLPCVFSIFRHHRQPHQCVPETTGAQKGRGEPGMKE
jgi:hypothetical protein